MDDKATMEVRRREHVEGGAGGGKIPLRRIALKRAESFLALFPPC